MTEAKPATETETKSEAKSETPSPADERRSVLLFTAVSLAAAGAVLAGLHFGVGVALDAPTLALAVACVVLIWSLRAMWGVVVALSRPAVETLIVEAEFGADRTSRAELREEKRRVLQAIKELEFDHAMGKLSDADFREVGDRYKLRAIEVLRELDGNDTLHPELAAHLAALGLGSSLGSNLGSGSSVGSKRGARAGEATT